MSLLKNKKYYIYQIWEMIRANIGDDDSLDERLIGAWLDGARAIWLSNELNRGNFDRDSEQLVGANGYVELELRDIGYPLTTETPVKVSTIDIPKQLKVNGINLLRVSHVDLKDGIFKIVDIDQLPYVGSSRFNKESIVSFILDNKIYLYCPDINNHDFKILSKITVRGYFEDPTAVSGYNEETSEYPISERLFSYLKNEIIKNNYKIAAERMDDINNNSDKS